MASRRQWPLEGLGDPGAGARSPSRSGWTVRPRTPGAWSPLATPSPPTPRSWKWPVCSEAGGRADLWLVNPDKKDKGLKP